MTFTVNSRRAKIVTYTQTKTRFRGCQSLTVVSKDRVEKTDRQTDGRVLPMGLPSRLRDRSAFCNTSVSMTVYLQHSCSHSQFTPPDIIQLSRRVGSCRTVWIGYRSTSVYSAFVKALAIN